MRRGRAPGEEEEAAEEDRREDERADEVAGAGGGLGRQDGHVHLRGGAVSIAGRAKFSPGG